MRNDNSHHHTDEFVMHVLRPTTTSCAENLDANAGHAATKIGRRGDTTPQNVERYVGRDKAAA